MFGYGSQQAHTQALEQYGYSRSLAINQRVSDE